MSVHWAVAHDAVIAAGSAVSCEAHVKQSGKMTMGRTVSLFVIKVEEVLLP